MCSKNFAFIMILSLLSGCSWLRDKPKASAQIGGNTLDLSCLHIAPTQLQNLFEGVYTDSEYDQGQVKAIWTCLDRSLDTFSKYTRGNKDGVYTARELQLFANRYLPEEKPLSPAFTNAIFRLKQAVLGGSDEDITQDEIRRLRDKLNGFGDMILPLAPHMSVLLGPVTQGSGDKAAAAAALNRFVLDIADLLSDSINPLQWLDLNAFIGELEKYTRVDKPTALTYVHEQVGVYQYFKLLLVGGNEFAIENTKWRPIFEAISHFYNALFLSNNTVEILDHLSIEVQSSEAEQQRAVDKLNALFKTLRSDNSLSSKKAIDNLADRWGKALVLNAIVFPRRQGSLALKTFLDSPGLRKLAGYLLDQVKAVSTSPTTDPAKIQALADNLKNFIVQASSENAVGNVLTPIAFGPLKDYVQQLKPLFLDDKEFQSTLLAIDLFKNAAPILCGKESDSYLPKDLSAVIQKAVDLYFAWGKDSKLSIFEAIGVSADIVLREPGVVSAKLEQVENTVQIAQQLMGLMNFKSTIKWDSVLTYVRNGFQLKSMLFGSSDRNINRFELKTLGDLWVPFRSGDDLPKSLAAVAELLKNNTFSPVPFDKLIATVNKFLPPESQVESLGIDAKMLGLLKSILIGGSETEITNKDYAPLARIGSGLLARLQPYQKELPKDFKFGLNSKSLEIAAAAIDGFADSVDKIEWMKIRGLIAATTQRMGLPVQESTLDKLVIGMSHRMFGHQKGPKPRKIKGAMTPDQLRSVSTLVKQIQKDFEEIEKAYTGLDTLTATLNRAQLNERLINPDLKHLVKALPPVLQPADQLIFFSGHGIGNDFGAYDLTYKALIQRALKWLLPAYQLEADDEAKNLRLTYNDTVDLLEDINYLILDLKLTYGVNPPPVTATKRMQTINIFTKSGNGDEYLDLDETTEFLTISAGGRVLLDNALAKLIKDCKLDAKTIERETIPYSCLTTNFAKPEYFDEVYSSAVPEMVKQYLKYTPEERSGFIESVFNATDSKWREKKEMTFSDFEVFVAVPYYAESVFERLDTDHSQVVNFTEAMAGYPLFCREIKKAAGPKVAGECGVDYPTNVEAVYGYLLMWGEPPRGPKPGDGPIRKLAEIKRVVGWFRYWKRLWRDPDYRNSLPPQLQRKDLVQIISNLAMATDSPQLELPDESGIDASSELTLPPGVPPGSR